MTYFLSYSHGFPIRIYEVEITDRKPNQWLHKYRGSEVVHFVKKAVYWEEPEAFPLKNRYHRIGSVGRCGNSQIATTKEELCEKVAALLSERIHFLQGPGGEIDRITDNIAFLEERLATYRKNLDYAKDLVAKLQGVDVDAL